MSSKFVFIFASLAAGSLVAPRAQFTPVALTPDSYNQDVVVEKGAIHAPPPSTTASMDEGSGNTAFGWYEMGYNMDAPDTGLPVAGSTATSAFAPDHSYTLPSDYTSNNALLIDTNMPSATLTLPTPASLAALSVLTAAGRGPVTNSVVVHYANGTAETNTFVAPDWFGTDAAITASGRIDVGTYGFDNVSSGNVNLYGVDIPLSTSGSPVASLEFRNGAPGNSHTAVFAVSGATTAGGEFTPVAVNGYNRDMVVEAGAPQPLTSLNATTASMDAGSANTGYSWYERGYYTNSVVTNALQTGLPQAGTTVTNNTAPDHIYVFPASYTGQNNAVLIDSENYGSLRFATPAVFSSLSFLTSAGGGAVTISYTINHQDGSMDTGTFVSPDWFNNPNAAYVANGRVGVQNGLIANVNSDNPRLYSVDLSVGNTNSPITAIDLALYEGTGHAAVFAVSGALGSVAPLVATQPASVSVFQGSAAQFSAVVSGSLPVSYTWQVETNGQFVNLQNGANVSGADTATLALNNVSFENAGQYRLAVTNSAGSALSLPVTLGVLSSGTTILSPSDTIEVAGGTSPDAEAVEHVIDQDTSKYLNFGTDGDTVAPFVGPVGFTVTPVLGSDMAGTIVNAIRVYTANDAIERDPASFTLEGSNNGTDFTLIASGPLALPDARNAGGFLIDPLTQAVQEVRFANNIPYTTYRVLFPDVKNGTTANSVQLAEVELLGTVATESATVLSIHQNTDGTLTITSPAAGTLESTTALGPNAQWTAEGPINGTVTVTPTAQAKFYRVVVQQ